MKLRLAAALLVLCPGLAWADDTQYQPFPIGGRALGMGGAFTAIADDASAIHYNPAGIVDAKSPSLDISTNLYGLQIAVGDNLLSSFADTITDFNKVFAELQIIPTTAGFVKAFGEKDGEGRYRHAFALGALVPAYKSVDIDTKSAPDAAGRVQTYRRSSLDRTLVGQMAYALRFDKRWRFGATLGFEYRHLSDREETEASSPATPAGNARFARGDSALSITTVALVLSVGALVSLPEGFSAGVSLNLPSVPVWGSAVARVSRSLADGEPPRTELVEDKAENLDAKSGGGASLRFGVAKVFSPGVEPTIGSLDLSLYAPRHYALLSLPGGDRPVRRSLTINTDVERRWVANLNLGVEHWLSPDWTLSGGLFTNFSSAPSIDDAEGKTRAADALPDVDTFGGTFALGWLGAHTLTTMGLELSYGTGKDVIADDQRLRPFGTEQFRVVRIRELSVFLFLSSTLMF